MDHDPTAEDIQRICEKRQCGIQEAREIAQGEAIIRAAAMARKMDDLIDLIVRMAADLYRINRL